jgi:hypothetical protein
MFMKIASMLLTFFLEKSAGTAGDPQMLAQISMQSMRKVGLLLSTGAAALIFFFIGLLTISMDLVLSTRDAGALALTGASGVGLAISLLAIGVLLVSFRKVVWMPTPIVVNQVAASNPLQGAIADLIGDYVLERQQDRLLRQQEARIAAERAAEATLAESLRQAIEEEAEEYEAADEVLRTTA